MYKEIRTITLAALCIVSVSVSAQTKEDMFNPVNASVTSQMIAPDARAAGMGDVGAATDPDVVSQYWNPAKYPFAISRAGVALNYTPWLRQLVNDMSLDVAYSLMLSEHFSLAAGVRWIYSDLTYNYQDDASPSSAFAADLALYYQNYLNLGARECQLGLGLNVSNIGSKISFNGSNQSEFIPTNMRLGASLMVPVDEYNRFTIAADANKLLVPTYPKQREGESSEDYNKRVDEEYYDVSSISGMFKSFSDAPRGFKEELEEIQWSVGAEYVYHDQFALRAGYHHESENKGNRKYFTVGAGFKMNVFSLDAGYVIATAKSNPLDQTLRFTLTFDMDGIKDLIKRR